MTVRRVILRAVYLASLAAGHILQLCLTRRAQARLLARMEQRVYGRRLTGRNGELL